MTLEDKELAAIVKKARRKNNRKIMFTIIFSLILFIGVPLTWYLRYYNYGPFQGDKMAGVPDNHLIQSENDNGLSSLLFDYGSHLMFNTHATSITVFVDTYHFGDRVGHDSAASLTYEKDVDLSGYMNIGFPKGEGKLLTEIFSKGAKSSAITDLTQYGYPTEDEEASPSFGGVISIENNQVKIQKKQEIPLFYLASGDALKIYDDFKLNIAQENLKTLDLVFYIYALVE